jgi:hypothetical protein
MTTTRKILMGLCMTFMVFVLLAALAAAQMPKTTTQQTKGAASVTTKEMKGTVVYVEGNTLVVKMSTGEVSSFNVPESRRFVIDGQEVTVRDLKPGTKLTATVATTTTPVTVRTTTVGSGKVWYVAAPYVILTLPNGENKQYKGGDTQQFIVDGRPATVFELKKGMTVSAQKIVEEPTTEITTDAKIVGEAPPPPPPPKAKAEPAVAPPPKAVAAPPVAPPVAAEPAKPVAEPAKPKLPKTASPFPMMGLLGLLFVGGSFGIRMMRRS